ncbi:MAG TPA: methyltransferase domain-containing protein [Opitutaceae bacterium]
MKPASTQPEFWDSRYRSGTTPWDLGHVPPMLARYLAARPGRGASVLIPGCGSGYEVAAFASAGYSVTAIDFSPPAVVRARSNLPPALAERVVEGDFFTYDFSAAPFDLVYERTILCALPPALWSRIVERTASLLKPGGTLVGLYFFGEKNDGPPFGLDPEEPARLFADRFAQVDDRAVPAEESLPLFVNRERWQERRRTR